MKYDYCETPQPTKTQYDNIGGDRTMVEAKYIHLFGCEGNPYLEALPPRTTPEMCLEKHTHGVRIPTAEERKTMTREDLILSLTELDKFRTLLPFHLTLERNFRSALESSYKKRYIVSDKAMVNNLQVNSREFLTHTEMWIREQSDAPEGTVVLGDSGCGKTTSVHNTVSTYPQTIIHNAGTMYQTTQIVYIHVECSNTNSFSDLYVKIGQCIDRALHNFDGTYEKMMSAKTTNSRLNTILEKLIEKFMIGMIILDEIEHMDVEKMTERSLDSFMRLANNTGVVIAVVGTQDTYEKLFSTVKTARRAGKLVQANRYCTNKEHFVKIVQNLCLFQWTDRKITFTAEEMETLYRCTGGVIRNIVRTYADIQACAIEGKKTDSKAIRDIMIRNYQGLKHAIDREADSMAEERRQLTLKNAMEDTSAEEIVQQAADEELFEKLMQKKQLNKAELCGEVVKAIQDYTADYNVSTIEKAFDKVISKKGAETMGITTLAMLTVAVLSKKKPDRKSRAKKTATEKMLDAVMTQLDLASADLQEGVVV